MEMMESDGEANTAVIESAGETAEMASWENLDEFFKEGYRSRFRYLGENLVQFNAVLGIRPIVPNAVDAIRDLYGPDLELLSEIEHRRWVKDKLEDGWVPGANAHVR